MVFGIFTCSIREFDDMQNPVPNACILFIVVVERELLAKLLINLLL
jgi:hypothetical protein